MSYRTDTWTYCVYQYISVIKVLYLNFLFFAVESMFSAMCECQALHPDPEDEDSDNDFEGEEYDVEEAGKDKRIHESQVDFKVRFNTERELFVLFFLRNSFSEAVCL